jgi:hypothetical protein
MSSIDSKITPEVDSNVRTVSGKKVKITFDNIEDHIEEHEKEIKEFLESRHPEALILFFNFRSITNELKNIDPVSSLLIHELIRRWHEVQKYIDGSCYNLVVSFLVKHDYIHSLDNELKDELENTLAQMIYDVCYENQKRVTPQMFKYVFEMLQLQHVDSKILGKITKLSQFVEYGKMYPDFNEKMMNILSDRLCNEENKENEENQKNEESQKNEENEENEEHEENEENEETELIRYDETKLKEHEMKLKEHESKLKEHEARVKEYESILKKHESTVKEYETKVKEYESKLNDCVTFENVKVGDIVDARDESRMWYVSKIVAKTAKSVTVHFFGWKSSVDETIRKSSFNNRIAKFKTITNGFKHVPKKLRKCKCHACTCDGCECEINKDE